MKVYIYRANFEIVNKGPSRVSKLFFSAPNLAWMINDHLVANIAQYFNFLPSQRYLKGCTKFILTVCVVYNAVISDWLTLTKTFSINSTHSWRKTSPLKALYKYGFIDFLGKGSLNYGEICSFRWCTKGNIVRVTQTVNERKEDQHFIYKKLQIQLYFFFLFAHTASENVNENLKERGKQILTHSPATPCKSNYFRFFLIPF